MAHIRRYQVRGGDRWRVMYRIGKQQVSDTFVHPDGATEYAQLVDRIGGQAAREVLQQRRAAAAGSTERVPTVTEWVLHHVDQLTGVEEGTKSDYRSYVRLSIEQTTIGPLPVDVVTDEHVERWVNHLATKGAAGGKKGLGGKTIKNRHALLSAAFARAVKQKIRPDNPAAGVALPRPEIEDMIFLTHDEFAIVLSKTPDHWKDLVAMLPGTGLRWSEATALQVRDLHLDDDEPYLAVVRAWKHTDGAKPLLKALPKSKKARRHVGLAPQIVERLRDRVDGRPPQAFVFTAPRGGNVRHNTFLESVWQPTIARATLAKDEHGAAVPADERITKHPRIHDLRHTYASWMIALGMSLTELQYAMGHESIQTTSDRYGHLLPGHRGRAAGYAEIALGHALK